MSWFLRCLCSKRLTAELQGEWFIDDGGFASFADGDIGDYNHERVALETMVPEHLIGDFENGRLTEDQIEEEGTEFKQFVDYMQRGGEARDYMVEHRNWIRVQGNNFQLHHLDQNAVNRIANFVSEQAFENGGTDDEDEEIYIEDAFHRIKGFQAKSLLEASSDPLAMSRLLTRWQSSRGGNPNIDFFS